MRAAGDEFTAAGLSLLVRYMTLAAKNCGARPTAARAAQSTALGFRNKPTEPYKAALREKPRADERTAVTRLLGRNTPERPTAVRDDRVTRQHLASHDAGAPPTSAKLLTG